MILSWRSLTKGFRQRAEALRRQLEHFTYEGRTVIAVTQDLRLRTRLHVLSLEQGWRICFADSIDHALRLSGGYGICVVVYDSSLPDVRWRREVRRLVCSRRPLFPIIIAERPDARLRSQVLKCGGYDVARSPVEPQRLAALVNGAMALAEDIESLDTCHQ